MAREYDRFSALPIGPSLAVGDGGLTATTTAPSLDLQRVVRGGIAQSTGSHGVEFAFWGEAALSAVVGLVQPSASLSQTLGQSTGSVGWNLAAGTVSLSGSVVASGLPVPAMQQIVGVVFEEQPGNHFVAQFYLGQTKVYEATLPAGASWYFAVSLSAAAAATLFVVVNSGQWHPLSDAARRGWRPQESLVDTVRVADAHFLTAATDSPPHYRYEGVVTDQGIETYDEVGFWPWSIALSPRGGTAQFSVTDQSGLLDAVALGTSTSIRLATAGGTLAASVALGRYVVDSIEPESDGRYRIRLRDAQDALDDLVNPNVFMPSIPLLAWKPQPLVIGAVASVPYLPANSDGSVGFLCDGALADVDVVMDRGDPMEVGTWTLYGANQLLMESPPLGPTLCDVSTVAADMTPATLQQALHALFSRVGIAAWNSSDAAAIDTATGYAGIGFYAGGAVSCRAAVDVVLANYAAATYRAPDGTIRFARLIDPETATAAATIDPAMLADDVTRVPDFAPNLSRRMGYQPNAAMMSPADFVTDLVDVPVQRRNELMSAHRGVVYSALPLASRYDAAERREPMKSFFWLREDAQAEIDRICGLYAVERFFYRLNLAGAFEVSIAPGDVVSLTYPLYGLDAGRKLLVVSVQQNRSLGRLALKLWGA